MALGGVGQAGEGAGGLGQGACFMWQSCAEVSSRGRAGRVRQIMVVVGVGQSPVDLWECCVSPRGASSLQAPRVCCGDDTLGTR